MLVRSVSKWLTLYLISKTPLTINCRRRRCTVTMKAKNQVISIIDTSCKHLWNNHTDTLLTLFCFTSTALQALRELTGDVYPVQTKTRQQQNVPKPKPVKSRRTLKATKKRKNIESTVGQSLKPTKRVTVLAGGNIGKNMISYLFLWKSIVLCWYFNIMLYMQACLFRDHVALFKFWSTLLMTSNHACFANRANLRYRGYTCIHSVMYCLMAFKCNFHKNTLS